MSLCISFLTYLLQHTIADEYRGEYNLSTNVYRKTDYDRLCLSLTSPLPNEQVRIYNHKSTLTLITVTVI